MDWVSFAVENLQTTQRIPTYWLSTSAHNSKLPFVASRLATDAAGIASFTNKANARLPRFDTNASTAISVPDTLPWRTESVQGSFSFIGFDNGFFAGDFTFPALSCTFVPVGYISSRERFGMALETDVLRFRLFPTFVPRIYDLIRSKKATAPFQNPGRMDQGFGRETLF